MSAAAPAPDREMRRLPLGSDNVVLQPAEAPLVIFATAECDVCDPSMVRPASEEPPAGLPERWPQDISFRVTASLDETPVPGVIPLATLTDLDPTDFLLGLKFQVRTFHGLEVRTLEPRQVRMIGMPADVPYRARIYSVSFRLDNVPVEDRLVLDILDGAGQRVTKFFLVLR
jgi:hypothetical protein